MLFASFSVKRKTVEPISLYVESDRTYLCAEILTITPVVISGNSAHHGFLWQAISGAPLTILSSPNSLDLMFKYSSVNRGDAVLRLTVDGSTHYDVAISSTPRDVLSLRQGQSTALSYPTQLASVAGYGVDYNTSVADFGQVLGQVSLLATFNYPPNTTYYTKTYVELFNPQTNVWEIFGIVNNNTQRIALTPQRLYRLVTEYDVTVNIVNTYISSSFISPPALTHAQFLWSTYHADIRGATVANVVINIPTLVTRHAEDTLVTAFAATTSQQVLVFDFIQYGAGTIVSTVFSPTSSASSFSITYFGSTTIGG